MTPDLGIRKKACKLTAIVMVVSSVVLLGITAHALPVDSNTTPLVATGAGSATISPIKDASDTSFSAPYGNPFLLERGYSDVNARGAGTVNADGGPGRYFFAPGSCGEFPNDLTQTSNYYGTNRHLPFCRGRLSTSKSCPENFIPVIKIAPASTSAQVANTPIFACLISPAPGNLGPFANNVFPRGNNVTGYRADFATPAASSNRGRGWEPFVSIAWDVYCYPTKKRTGTYATSNLQIPNIEGCHIARASVGSLDTSILLWDVGLISTIPSVNGPSAFRTNRHCPLGYSPYITLGKGTIADTTYASSPTAGQHSILGPSGTCIQTVALDTGNPFHTVTFLAKATSMDIAYSGTSLTISDPTQVNAINQIPWTLYCYPPNATPPAYSPACALNQAPFQ